MSRTSASLSRSGVYAGGSPAPLSATRITAGSVQDQLDRQTGLRPSSLESIAHMSFGGPSQSKNRIAPPERGSFPLDHEGTHLPATTFVHAHLISTQATARLW